MAGDDLPAPADLRPHVGEPEHVRGFVVPYVAICEKRAWTIAVPSNTSMSIDSNEKLVIR